MREKYESLAATVLKDLAKARGIKGASSMRKAELVEAMLAQDALDAKSAQPEKAEKPEPAEKPDKAPRADRPERAEKPERGEKPERAEKSERPERRVRPRPQAEPEKPAEEHKEASVPQDIPTDGLLPARGIIEVMSDGFGFIRCDNYMPGTDDVYVSQSQIKKFNLKTGDIIIGKKRFNNPTDKFAALMIIDTINGYDPAAATRRPNFEDLTPIFPNERIRLERQRSSVAMRIVDLVRPIGKGQRGMIVAQPKAGKTTLLKEVATSVNYSHPDMHLIILLIDERPEEVTDMQRSIKGEVVYSTFDKRPENHVRVTELVLERAMRLVELGQDVVILLDSMTRLARAYNLTINPTGRTLSGGLDPGSLYGPKRFFGAARNIEFGGSLTIIASALIETGSRMDEVIFEEFKGTGNMEVVLDRKLADRRVYPAIAVDKSGTRREDLLLTEEQLSSVWLTRKAIADVDTIAGTEAVLNFLKRTPDNASFVLSAQKSFSVD